MTRSPTLTNPSVAATEVPFDPRVPRDVDEVFDSLGRMALRLGWTNDANMPFKHLVTPGARVVVKPNWVMHYNSGGGGLGPLVTDPAVIRATVAGLLRSPVGQVIVGDAPLQACDFESLIDGLHLREWARDLMQADHRFAGLRDFRRTKCTMDPDGIREVVEDCAPLTDFVLFDLKGESLLEPVTDKSRFRVTQYDPRHLSKTHRAGRHQYLVSRFIIEADLVVNLPKLKTHKKAGVTCALKNLIGINGNKEYLPHHRLGGAASGGDCYPERNTAKRLLEAAFDQLNKSSRSASARVWSRVTRILQAITRLQGDEIGVEGAWSGNDTIWRTCLDLNRILLYGTPEGGMMSTPQRTVLHIVDAIEAGQGDGPLSPESLSMGLLLASTSAPAVDLLGTALLGYDPARITTVSRAFDRFRWPLTTFTISDVSVLADESEMDVEQCVHRYGPTDVTYPTGWRDAASRVPATR